MMSLSCTDHYEFQYCPTPVLAMTTVVPKDVFSAATNGMFHHGLIKILDTMDSCDVQAAINQASPDGHGQYGTPLVIAARNGFENVVDILVNRYHASTEQEGHVRIDGFSVEGATPLWCAAAAGHLPVVKLLVKAGAHVNHEIENRNASTPVRAACFYGHLDIVRYLADHGADLNQPNKNHSCLMTACAKGHSDTVEFLLEKGVDVYQKEDSEGSSAMHFAVEEGHLDIVKLLLNAGVKMQVDSYGMTPLMSAAQRKKIDVVEFLLKQDDHVTKKEKIDALELLGAAFANHEDFANYNNRLDLCYKFLYRAMLLRFEDSNDPYPKSECAEVNTAYGQRGESKNLSELEGIKDNHGALYMESLMIRERILGQHNPAVAKFVIIQGYVYSMAMRFEECIRLYLHGLYLLRINKCSVSRNLWPYARMFFQMYTINTPIMCDYKNAVVEAALEELARLKVKISNLGNTSDVRKYEMDKNLADTLFMIRLMMKVKDMLSLAEMDALKQLICDIVKVGAVTRKGYTLLHLSIYDSLSGYLRSFPCADIAIQLIKCGADVNALDNYRNTPLHTILSSKISDSASSLNVRTIVSALLDANCHCDIVNGDDWTPVRLLESNKDLSGVADIFQREIKRYNFNLMCLASRVIIRRGIPYAGKVPKKLKEYIELHGRVPRRVRNPQQSIFDSND